VNVNAAVIEGLVKDYPKVRAVDKVSFAVAEGEIFGLLGPNGAGKTTTIRILLTLIKPTGGKASLFGVDVAKHPEKARQTAGYVSQDISVDGELTGYENILMYAKLYGVSRQERKTRIPKVLHYLDLDDRADDLVSTFSGGMMRRLEIAQALVNRPRILFLDEPSIGLDPNARRVIWDLVRKLRDEFGTTIFITTHDMAEADSLCDRIGIMDKGRLVTIDEPSKLKRALGGNLLTLRSNAPGVLAMLKELGYSVIAEHGEGRYDIAVSDGESLVPRLMESLWRRGVEVEAVSLKEPTLDDVFLRYTGGRMGDGGGEAWTRARRARKTFRRLTR
jgi:ABC-2 type transport system ATP-binding protein